MYTKSTDAPKLLASAIALGVNGVTAGSTEQEKLTAITKLQDDVATMTNLETNMFLEALANKVLLQNVFKRMQFKDPLTKTFFKEGVSFSASKEIIDNKLLTAHSFDKTKRYPTDQTKAKVLNTILRKSVKEYLTNTVQIAGVRAAFASDMAFGEWLAKQTDLLAESLQVILFEELSPLFVSEIKNTITLDATKFDTLDKIFIAINEISKDMAKIPSAKYNLGFADAKTAVADEKSRKQITPRDRQLIISSVFFGNALEGGVSAVKFHNAFFKIDQYKGHLQIDMPTNEIILMDQNAAEGYFRVNQWANNAWGANLTIEYFLHYWYVFGFIPWANGVKIQFTLKADEQNSALPATA